MSTEEKQHNWQAHIESWQNSGKPQRQFCSDNQLNYSTFRYWRAKLSQTKAVDSKWLPIKMTTPSSSTVILPGVVRIETSAQSLLEMLPGILRLLKAMERC
jgi:hypothetical protein